MNCLGRGNYHLFLSILASLGVMLCYGAYLSYRLLDLLLQESFVQILGINPDYHWSRNMTLAERFDYWANAFIEDIRIAAPGLLCVFTAPLAWGLLTYHVYLIWAGMTTNESFKWDEWKEDIADGYVYKTEKPKGPSAHNLDPNVEPAVSWPVSTPQRLVNRANELSMQQSRGTRYMDPPWQQVQSLKEIVNIYDLGFLDNLTDVFRHK